MTDPLFRILLGSTALVSAGLVAGAAAASPGIDRPNILWITCEDMSLNLGCYGDDYARTPEIDALAEEGVRFTHAFASAPVCSPVRSGIITGCYATSLGTQRLRSTFPVPTTLRPFTEALREAGYYCVNNVKTDYNLQGETAWVERAWDESSAKAHWRNRPAGRPFFAVMNLMTTHQSRASVWSHEEFEAKVGSRLSAAERHDPALTPLPPYYPDTREVRRTVARHYDCVSVMDRQVGKLLGQLAEDGLAEDTIVFFFSDHGSGLPRGKRVLQDSGLQIPLIVRFPERYAHWAPADPGERDARLVTTIDLGPTVLALAGQPVPARVEGQMFLGQAVRSPREVVIGARDRVDEVYDLARSVRDRRYLYIRNYMPHLSWMPPEAYSDQSLMRQELKRLALEGKLNAEQLTYAAPRRSREELYDTEKDPYQVHNLAGAPEQQGRLERMRRVLQEWILTTRDAGFAPETYAWDLTRSGRPPAEWVQDDVVYPLERLERVAGWVGRPEQLSDQVTALGDPNPAVRYWAAVGLRAAAERGGASSSLVTALKRALSDPLPEVRVEAAVALVYQGEAEEALNVLQAVLRSARGEEALVAARALELLGDQARLAWPVMREVRDAARGREGDYWMFVDFSLGATLQVP